MRVGRGLAELNAPLYDKPLWNDEGSIVEAPTLRAVVDFGVSVGALLAGNPWAIAAIGLADDALFGMMDLAGGYRGLGEVGLDLGRKVLVGAATAGVGVAGGIAADLLAPAAGAAAGGIAGAVTWNAEDGWGWDSRVLAGRLVGRDAFANYLGSAAGTLITAGLGTGVAENRFMAGVSRAAAGLGGETARWLYYLGAEASWNPGGLGVGSLAARALDDMGGLTVNLANVGAVVDALMLAKEGQGGYEAEEYKALALAARRLSASGMLELTIGSTGTRLALGGGGVDLGGSAYGLAKGTVVEALISTYAGSDELKDALRHAYASGDHAAEATVWRVLAGTDRIVEGVPEGAAGRTTSDSNGSRTLAISRGSGGQWDALDLAVRLQHESWRDGTADAANSEETLEAALAHTRLARSLGARKSGYLGQAGGLLAEVQMLNYAEQTGDYALFGRSVASRYDSSDDYWRLVTLEGGGHALEFDNRADIYDEAGNFLVGTGTTGVQTALSSYLGVTMAEAGSIMLSTGMMADAHGLLEPLHGRRQHGHAHPHRRGLGSRPQPLPVHGLPPQPGHGRDRSRSSRTAAAQSAAPPCASTCGPWPPPGTTRATHTRPATRPCATP